MELEGHPTADLIEELVRRGAASTDRRNPANLSLSELERRHASDQGFWMFIPASAFETGLDDAISD